MICGPTAVPVSAVFAGPLVQLPYSFLDIYQGCAHGAAQDSNQFIGAHTQTRMKAEALIEHEPFRVFRYSLDGGQTWLTCISTLRGDSTAAVKRDLEIRYRFPVIVRAPGGNAW